MKEKFNIPVVIFIFKRYKTVLQIIERIRAIAPTKIYLIGDGPRSLEEKELIKECRCKIEKAIDWPCELVKNYSEVNRGVYENIGKGAAWVFSKEEKAIFLEDDNLPEISFFRYCEELLEKYEDNDNILWITGTNYLTKYKNTKNVDYVFTRHLLPCGWASWKSKYLKYYDGDLVHLYEKKYIKRFKKSYTNRLLCSQQLHSICTTKRKLEKKYPVSWDFQMCFSLRSNNLYGISPCYNQIQNIGVDIDSTHGGSSMNIEMTKRFCNMKTICFEFPLKHPTSVEIDPIYEKQIDKIILWPISTQIKYRLCYLIKPFLGLKKYDSMSDYIKYKKKGWNKNEKKK